MQLIFEFSQILFNVIDHTTVHNESWQNSEKLNQSDILNFQGGGFTVKTFTNASYEDLKGLWFK